MDAYMRYCWVIWLLVLIALIATPGLIPSERHMTDRDRLYLNASLAWMYGVPALLILMHLYLWIRRRAKN